MLRRLLFLFSFISVSFSLIRNPTFSPTRKPTTTPTFSQKPTFLPTASPSRTPTYSQRPTTSPTVRPSRSPTYSQKPTRWPTFAPTMAPTKETLTLQEISMVYTAVIAVVCLLLFFCIPTLRGKRSRSVFFMQTRKMSEPQLQLSSVQSPIEESAHQVTAHSPPLPHNSYLLVRFLGPQFGRLAEGSQDLVCCPRRLC
jgi:hypothetical protein